MDEETSSMQANRRRWYQFSVKSLLVALTVAVLLFLFWRERILRVEAEGRAQRNATLAQESMEEARDSIEMARKVTLYASDLEEKVRELEAQVKAIGKPEGDASRHLDFDYPVDQSAFDSDMPNLVPTFRTTAPERPEPLAFSEQDLKDMQAEWERIWNFDRTDEVPPRQKPSLPTCLTEQP